MSVSYCIANLAIDKARDLVYITTDLQPVIYYTMIHILELFYFDSNTIKIDEIAVDSSASPNLLLLFDKTLPTSLAFTSICNVSDVKKRCYTV